MKDYGNLQQKIIVSEETRKKMSDSHKGKRRSQETRAKMSAVRKGVGLSDESIEKIRQSVLKNFECQEYRDRIRLSSTKLYYRGKSLKEWAKILDVHYSSLSSQFKKNGNIDLQIEKYRPDLLDKPSNLVQENLNRRKEKITKNYYRGIAIAEWAKILDLRYSSLSRYFKKHGNIDRQIEKKRPDLLDK